MSQTTAAPTAVRPRDAVGRPPRPRRRRSRARIVPGVLGFIWLVIACYPILYVLLTSLRSPDGFLSEAPWSPPSDPTFGTYRRVLEADIGLYFVNSVVVTLVSVLLILAVSIFGAYVVARIRSRAVAAVFTALLFGLAIPLQATVIPLYLLIANLGVYDTLLALILPYTAFGIPLTMLILVTFLRDIPTELFDAMRIEGASHLDVVRNLVIPLARPALVTVAIYNAIQIWNGFLFPLILTQSANTRLLPLALWNFQGEYAIDVPAIMAAVTLSTMPLVLFYLVGRRQLLSGLTAGFGK